MIIQGKVWGHTRPLFQKNNVEIHDIFVNKGGYCSKHRHSAKYNKFVVNSGKLLIRVWKEYVNGDFLEEETILSAGHEMTVGPGDFHMFEALEDTIALEIYWVELKETDIERENHGGKKIVTLEERENGAIFN